MSSWWFQPIWKISYNQIGSFPQIGMKIKMFETTTQLCSGAFVVNTNPFIFAPGQNANIVSKTPILRFAIFCVMTPKSRQNQQLTLPSTWSFWRPPLTFVWFQLGGESPHPMAFAGFIVHGCHGIIWGGPVSLGRMNEGDHPGFALSGYHAVYRYAAILQYGCTTSRNQPRIIHIIRFTVGPHEDLWFTTTFQRLTTSHLVLLGQHLVRGWPATLYPVILRILGFWTAPHLVGKYHDPWRPYELLPRYHKLGF